MTTNTTILATSATQRWHNFWRGEIGGWILDRGLHIIMLFIAAVLAVRFVTWVAKVVTERLDLGFAESDALVRSEATKHRQALASVISWVSIVLIWIIVLYEVIDILPVPVGSLVGPAAVLGAALGFGAQRVVQDLLAGFFIIVERQYGFGDLVELSMVGSPENAGGTVEEVTLRVTKLRSSRRRGLHRPQWKYRQVGQSLQGLGACGGGHPGADQRRPQPGQRGLAPGM